MATNKHSDVWAYKAAEDEFRTGKLRDGLMLKALSDSSGDQYKANYLYVKYLSEIIISEKAHSNISHLKNNINDAAQEAVRSTSDAVRNTVPIVTHIWEIFVKCVFIGLMIGLISFFANKIMFEKKVAEFKSQQKSTYIAPPKPTTTYYPAPLAIKQAANVNVQSEPVHTSPIKHQCEYKQIMTDDDYRLCGINPPGR